MQIRSERPLSWLRGREEIGPFRFREQGGNSCDSVDGFSWVFFFNLGILILVETTLILACLFVCLSCKYLILDLIELGNDLFTDYY